MNKIEDAKNMKIYYDYKEFKGNTFEKNINSINNLYFGQGIAISETPFIYIDEKEKKNYLSTNCFIIESYSDNKNNSKMICYPISFLNLIFYSNNLLFNLDSNNRLIVFKFEKDSFDRYEFQQKQHEQKVKTNKCGKETIDEIIQKLAKIDENNKLTTNYEILCGILKNDLNENLNIKTPKQINGSLIFELDEFKCKCTIKNIRFEIDGVGKIREKLSLTNGIISFEEGINSLIKYVKLKKEGNPKANDIIDNIFKTPILYKNFKENTVPENQTIICEIKSGFAISDLKKQLNDRILAIRNCLFTLGEKPSYFIGILNFDSNNLDKLEQFSKYSLELNENALIVATVDYQYCGIDISCEIHSEYLLYKKIGKLESKLDETNKRINDMDEKFDNKFKTLDAKIDGISAKLNEKIDGINSKLVEKIDGISAKLDKNVETLLNVIKMFHPSLNIYLDKVGSVKKEEKKDSI